MASGCASASGRSAPQGEIQLGSIVHQWRETKMGQFVTIVKC